MACCGGGQGGNGFVCRGDKKGGQLRSVSVFVTHEHRGGANITPILPTLPHCTPRALCGSIKKNTDSLVKGMILFDQGRGGGEGEKGNG